MNDNFILPSWESFETMVDGIWEREYYTNHGPLVKELELKIEKLCGVKHAICMTNHSIALMIALKALECKEVVGVPCFSHINVFQSVNWARLSVKYLGVKNDLPLIDVDLTKSVAKNLDVLIAVNLFGQVCDIDAISKLAEENNLKVIYLSDSLFSSKIGEQFIGSLGDLEIFSFRESQLINGADGACICTSDDLIAAKLRNIRSSYGAGYTVPIPYTGNGRMSEIQAGLILLSLEDREINIQRNRNNFYNLKNKIKNPKITLIEPSKELSNSSYSEIVIKFDGDNLYERKLIVKKALDKMQVFYEDFKYYGIDVSNNKALLEFENLETLKNRFLLISNNQKLTDDCLNKIAELLSNI